MKVNNNIENRIIDTKELLAGDTFVYCGYLYLVISGDRDNCSAELTNAMINSNINSVVCVNLNTNALKEFKHGVDVIKVNAEVEIDYVVEWKYI